MSLMEWKCKCMGCSQRGTSDKANLADRPWKAFKSSIVIAILYKRTVEVPGSAFHLAQAAVRVPTVAAMNALLPTLEVPTVSLGSYDKDATVTEVVCWPQNTQLIPGPYAVLLVHQRVFTAKVASQGLYGAMFARHEAGGGVCGCSHGCGQTVRLGAEGNP